MPKPSEYSSPPGSPEPGDLLVHGGPIHSLDPARPHPEVLALRGGRVLALGGRELLGEHPGAARLDLGGRTLVPGLIDSHAHFLGLGEFLERLDLSECRSFDELLAAVRAAVERLGPGEPLLGRGWNQELWPGRAYPSHERLSAIAPGRSILLTRADAHAVLANAFAMEKAGIDAASVAPPGGAILRRADGKPTGVFVDRAMELLGPLPETSLERREAQALRAQEACLRAGLTGVHDAGEGEVELALLERLTAEGRLRLRLNVMLSGDFDDAGRPADWLRERLRQGPRKGVPDRAPSVTAVKIFLDGALGSHGAALLDPYSDRPGERGLLRFDAEELMLRLRQVEAAGFQAAVHAIGDAANRMVLDAFEEVLGGLGPAAAAGRRFRIEHAQVLHPEDLPRFAALGIVAAVQPIHCVADAGMTEERLGPARAGWAHPWRGLLASGARIALGSDFPVESERPLLGLHAALTRRSLRGEGGAGRPEDCLSPAEALRGFTIDAAHAGFQERDIGSLSPGKRADFIVLPIDPLAAPPDELLEAEVESTWIGGRELYRSGASALGGPDLGR